MRIAHPGARFRGVCNRRYLNTKDSPTVPKQRSARALNNDAAIRTAAVTLVLSKGIDAISFRDVGREAGLTHGALYARFEDVEELLVDLWDSILTPRAVALIELASAAAADRATKSFTVSLRTSVKRRRRTKRRFRCCSRRGASRSCMKRSSRSYVTISRTNAEEVSQAVQSRALVVFSLLMTAILSNSQFGSDFECLDFLETIVVCVAQGRPRRRRSGGVE